MKYIGVPQTLSEDLWGPLSTVEYYWVHWVICNTIGYCWAPPQCTVNYFGVPVINLIYGRVLLSTSRYCGILVSGVEYPGMSSSTVNYRRVHQSTVNHLWLSLSSLEYRRILRSSIQYSGIPLSTVENCQLPWNISEYREPLQGTDKCRCVLLSSA